MTVSLSHYTFDEKLHEGADVVLYRGHRDADGERVTLKVPRSEHPGARDLAKLRHEQGILHELSELPAVVRAHRLEKYGDGLALVLEDLDGLPLSALLRTRRLALDELLRLSIALVAVMAELHRRRIIHKDIKPQNIICDREVRRVRLTGFGVATRLSQEMPRAVAPDAIEGTLAYMSPEQTGRMNRAMDYRADYYSLGVTLYEVLTGALPFDAATPMEMVHSHIARTPVPPHERAASIPASLSAIVMKLLAKAAEDRYQSAYGLAADLRRCQAQLEAGTPDEVFPLGRSDHTDELHIPPKLYGRAREGVALAAAFDRIRLGGAELLLVKGSAGVGKSSLVSESHRLVAQHGGYFVAGKFDQFNRSVPYASFAQAFRELCQQLLTERPESLSRWKDELGAALGPSARILIDIIPELELLVGPQPAAPVLGPTETKNRFNLVFQEFVHVCATEQHPLVLFLDDLQWADPGSLRLLHLLLNAPERRHLLIVGAYRGNEVNVAHPLVLTLDDLRKSGGTMSEIKLGALAPDDILALLVDTLSCTAEKVAPLARVVQEKTHGNPFFINRFLAALHAEGLLRFDAPSGSFAWNIDAIRAHQVTDNVVDFMAGKIQELAPETIRVLELAACIGHRFDLHTLSRLNEQTSARTAAQLWEALEEGMAIPIDMEYRFLHLRSASSDSTSDEEFNVAYRFVHDRVHQAAYSLLNERRREETHLRLGRLLWADSGGAPQDEILFDLVNHMNIGAALITEPADRLELGRLNLAAGKKAKAATAYQTAAAYLESGMTLLADAAWDLDYDLAFGLHAERAECEYLSGRFDQAERLFEVLLARARSTRELLQIHELRVLLYCMQGHPGKSLDAGRAALALLDVAVPSKPEELQAALGAEFAAVQVNLAGREILSLRHAPPLANADVESSMRLLVGMCPAAYFTDAMLLAWLGVKQVNLSLIHGHCNLSAYAFMLYGLVSAGVLGRYEEAYQFGRLALDLNEQFDNADLVAKLNFIFGSFISHFRRPLRESLPYLEHARRAGLESGDFQYASFGACISPLARLSLGDALESVREEVDQALLLMQRTQDVLPTSLLTIQRQLIGNLKGETHHRFTLSDDRFDEEAFLASMEAVGLTMVACWYYAANAEVAFLHGDPARALSMAKEAEKRAGTATAMYFTTDLAFFTALSLAARIREAPEAEREEATAALASLEARLATWAESCPENFRHKHLLVLAERAQAAEQDSEALTYYDQAIEWARSGELARDEALANELCANFHLRRGRNRHATTFLGDAYRCYRRWGATAKSAALKVVAAAALDALPAESGRSSEVVTGAQLDVATVLSAAQAIAGELVLDTALERIMRTVVVNAGAQRGFLILERNEKLYVEAMITVEPERVEVRLGTPIGARTDLATTVVRYVARSREAVVLARAGMDRRFAEDPYIASQKPRSILCLALTRGGRLTGVLYLENNAADDSFAAERIEVLGLLASQATITVENALLYEHVQTVTDQLRESNQGLHGANAQLRIELSERVRAESERANLQEQIIRVQRDRLAEMSTPLIPITERIMVMPLIGTMDRLRATQVLETALRGAQGSRAQVVIIDITGMKHVDSGVAGALLSTATALRLVGAEAVLTGIRPEIAQTLVALGVELRSIVTCGTLQSGISFALGKTGESRFLRATTDTRRRGRARSS
jgi:predicted ATPase/anti-anti-sigma regulatory factor/tRNA A-37 threonylcarbamoyl transferase component Bud32